MIKKINFFCFTFLFLSACSNNQNTDKSETKNKYKVVAGHIKNAANKSISLRIFDGKSMRNATDTTIDKNGNFHISIADTSLIVCQLIIDKSAVLPLVLSNNDSIFITTSYPNLLNQLEIKNSTYAKVLKAYLSKMDTFLRFQDSLIQAAGNIKRSDTAKINSIRKTLLKKKKSVEFFVTTYIKNNPASPVNILLAQEIYPSNGMEFWDTTYLQTLKNLQRAFQKKFPKEKYTTTLFTQIQSWEASLNEYHIFKEKSVIYGGKKFNIAIGETAPEIQMKNPDGKIIRLTDLRGKYVLLDFWASWCGPCRRENPNVVRLHKKYKNRGFTIFSVSLDKKRSDWLNAIKKDQLSWKNHVCDFDGWDSFIASVYKVRSIPFTVLLDKKGKIIALNLRGQQLEQKLISLLGN